MKTIEELEQDLKDIQSQIDKLKKPKLKIGEWGWRNGYLFFYKEVDKSKGSFQHLGYGLDMMEEDVIWKDEMSFNQLGIDAFRKATQEEVEQALIKEAKRRYKVGDKVKSLQKVYGVIEITGLSGCNKDNDSNNLWVQGSKIQPKIFENGKWAEILNKVVINGHEMKVDGDIVSFGCAKFAPDDLKRWLYACEDGLSKPRTNRKIKSITLDSGVELTVEQLKEIVDNL